MEKAEVVSEYTVCNDCVLIQILKSETGFIYKIVEPELDEESRKEFEKLIEIMSLEMRPFSTTEDVTIHIRSEINRLLAEHSKILKLKVLEREMEYYIFKSLTYGELYPIMEDDNVEDIKCIGYNRPIMVYHRSYGWMRTNIMLSKEAIDSLAMKLAHLAGRTLSIGKPIEEGTLPDGSRINVSYGREVSDGTSFTIRKFKTTPLCITDLLKSNTLNELICAYLWMMLDAKKSIVIYGPTGSGKTTLLNALLELPDPRMFLLTIEDIPELNIQRENWERLFARRSFYSDRRGEIDLETLARVGLRRRPDLLAIGEVLGREAFVLFQAIMTGHGGACTIHGETAESVISRLTSRPMDIPKEKISAINVLVEIRQVDLPKESQEMYGEEKGRRVTAVYEVMEDGSLMKLFEWRLDDSFSPTLTEVVRKSRHLKHIMKMKGWDETAMRKELHARISLLEKLKEQEIKGHALEDAIRRFYLR